MKKKGFTLIELLAVIVILAIIALIATPLVLKYIEYSKEKSAKLSAQTYAEAVEKEYVSKLASNEKMPNKDYTIKELDELGVKVKGDKPEGDKDYVVLNNGNVTEYVLTIKGYIIIYENGKTTVDSNKDGVSNSKKIDAIDHTVTFTVNGEPYEIMSVKDGNSVVQPYNDPVVDGFNFGGWGDIDGTPITFPLKPTKDTEIIAIDWSLSDVLRDAYGIDKKEFPYIHIFLTQTVQLNFYNLYIDFLPSYQITERGFSTSGGHRYSGRLYHKYVTTDDLNDPEKLIKLIGGYGLSSENISGDFAGSLYDYTNFTCTYNNEKDITHYIFN